MTLATRRAAAVLCLAMLPGCATNPATGQRQIMLVSEGQEIAMGQQADKDVAGSLGLYPDDEVQAYVARVGAALVTGAERSKLPWTFRVVDDPTVNAFALPGGFVYVTRGLMTDISSEAQLASVMGHEIGHVTARHSVSQITKSQLATIGLVAGMIARPDLQQFGNLAQTGMQLMFLKFSRHDESQADDLGLRYMGKQGYDPREMVSVFTLLDRVSQQSRDGRVPSWLSSHPAPDNRAQHIEAAIKTQALSGTKVERAAYLRQIDGMVFGENPREGFFEDETFFHPELRWQLDFPRGWKTQNQKQAVAAMSPDQDAMVVLTLVEGTSAERAADEFLGQQGLRAGRAERTRVHGLPAVTAIFEAATEQMALAGRVSFVEYGGKVYRLLGYSVSQRFRAYERLFDDALSSFAPLTDRARLDVQPARLEVVELSAPTTVDQLVARQHATASREVIALINGVAVDGTLPAGPAKTVVGGRGVQEKRRP